MQVGWGCNSCVACYSNAVTRERPKIATTVERLRQRARLSQRKLAELGNVSAPAIARIEHGFDRKTGGPVKPLPDTLHGIARGLAATEDGPGDEASILAIYRQLLEAAGYDIPASDPIASPHVDDLRQQIEAAFGGDARQIEDFLIQSDRLNQDDKRFVLRLFALMRSMLPTAEMAREHNRLLAATR